MQKMTVRNSAEITNIERIEILDKIQMLLWRDPGDFDGDTWDDKKEIDLDTLEAITEAMALLAPHPSEQLGMFEAEEAKKAPAVELEKHRRAHRDNDADRVVIKCRRKNRYFYEVQAATGEDRGVGSIEAASDEDALRALGKRFKTPHVRSRTPARRT